MSAFEKELRKKIESMIPDFSIVGKVTTVDETKYTCNVMPIDNEAELFKVRLKPTIDTNKKGCISIPAIGSFVIVGFLKKKDASPFVIWCSNFEKYYIVGDGGNIIEFKNDGTILINGDDEDGLVKVNDLVTKINALENLVNTILSTLKATVIPLAPSGTYPFASLYASANTISPLTNKAALENIKVKHGGGNWLYA